MVRVFYYDKENDILAIHKGFPSDDKFKGNVDVGNLILDVSAKGKIRGIEIINVTNYLKGLGFKITKKVLSNLKDATFKATIKPNGIIIGIFFKSDFLVETSARIAVPLETPQRH